MNWQEVKNSNPKSFEALQTRVRDVYVYNVSENDFTDYETGFMRVRELYDFFDEQELQIILVFVNKNSWGFQLWNNTDLLANGNGNRWGSRTEAEEQAFLRAFEILEDKLKEGR